MDRNSFIDNKMLRKSLLCITIGSICGCIPELMLPIIAGHFVSDASIAAMNLCRPVVEGYMLLAILFTSGSIYLTAKEIGKGFVEKASAHYSSAIYSVSIFQLVFTLIILALRFPISAMLSDSNPELIDLCSEYLGVVIVNALPYSLNTMLSMFAAMDGQPQKAAIAGAVGLLCTSVSILLPFEYSIGRVGALLIIYNVASLAVLCPYIFSRKFSLRLILPGKQLFSHAYANIHLGMHRLAEHVIKIICLIVMNTLVQYSAGTDGSIIWGLVCSIMVLCELLEMNLSHVQMSVGSVLRGEHDMQGLWSLILKTRRILLIGVTLTFMLSMLFPNAVMRIFGVGDGIGMSTEFRMALPMLFVCSLFMHGSGLYFLIADFHKSMLTAFLYNIIPVVTLCIAYLFLPGYIWPGFLVGGIICAVVYVIYSHRFEVKMEHMTKDIVSLETSIPYDMSQIGTELSVIREFGRRTHVPDDVMDRVEHCIDELSYNIIKHCPDSLADKYYNLRMIVREHEMEVFFKDAGRPFNPVIEYKDTALEAEQEGRKLMLALRLFNYYASEPQYRYMSGINFTRMKYKF